MIVLAGVDVGGSGIRALVRTADEDRRAAVERPVHLGSTIDSDVLASGIVDVLGRTGAPSAEIVCIGMTGFPGLVDDPERIARRVMSATTARSVLVASDSLTTHVGALGMDPGVVVAAGTGVIALGTDHAAQWNRVDGWGYLLGDEGSGAWIGRAGLVAAIRAHDGRGGSPALLDALLARYGEVPVLLQDLHANGSPAYRLAQFAPAVAEAALDGDAVAASIWAEAARLLAATAIAAAHGVAPVFSWGGGLFLQDELLRRPFIDAVRQASSGAEFREPQGGSLDGAVRLAALSLETGELPTGEYLQVFVA